MDCIEAQAVISEALDRSPVDAELLEAAKVHCRECEQCADYVRVLSAMQRAPLPAPPDDLVPGIMDTIHKEAAAGTPDLAPYAAPFGPAFAEGAAPGANLEAAATAPGSGEPGPTDAPSGSALESAQAAAASAVSRVSLGRSPDERRNRIAWASAAAVLIVVVGIGAGLGIMRLSGGNTTIEVAEAPSTAEKQATVPELAAPGAGGGIRGQVPGTYDSGSQSGAPLPVSGSGLWVVVDGDAYLHSSVASDTLRSGLRGVGQTRLAFSPDAPSSPRTVFGGSEAGTVYVADDSNQLHRFRRVTRFYKNVTYRLQGTANDTPGSWPTLAQGVPHPAPENNPNGTPAFTEIGKDDAGTSIYVRVGSDERTGIAIPPNTPAPDPAGGNPNWTWWVP